MIAALRRHGVLGAAAIMLLAAFMLECVGFVRANSQTYDEAISLASGSLLWRGGPEINAEHPPFARRLAAMPLELFAPPKLDVTEAIRRGQGGFEMGRTYLYEGGVPFVHALALGRTPMVVCAVLLVALIGVFAWRLFGPHAGLLALFLAAFDPNLVAHGSLVSTDGPLALFATLAAFALSELFARPRAGAVIATGIAVGVCLVTKFSGLVVAAGMCAGLVVQAIATGGVPAMLVTKASPPRGIRSVAHALLNAVCVLGVAVLVVRLFYGGERGLSGYVDGVRAQMAHQEGGHPAYFLGAVSRHGWTSYFPVALLVKEPPLTIVLAALSLVAFRRGAPLGRAVHAVLVPALVILAASLFVGVDIGVRYVLPIVPLLVVLGSRIVTFEPPRRAVAILGLVALLHHAVAAVRAAPHQIAFFSDAIGGPSRGERWLSDSNLDWGQDLGALAEWADRMRPRRLLLAYFGSASIEAYGIAYEPAPNACPHVEPWRSPAPESDGGGEFLAVSAMNAQGVFFSGPNPYRWLADRTPVARLGWSIAIYDIGSDAAAHRELAKMYRAHGPPSRAEIELGRADAIEQATR